MPAIRPAQISDGVSLSDKLGTEGLALVSEHGAVDSVLFWLGVVNKLSPHEQGVGAPCSQNDGLSRSNELRDLAMSGSLDSRVVAFIHRETRLVSVFRNPPERFIHFYSDNEDSVDSICGVAFIALYASRYSKILRLLLLYCTDYGRERGSKRPPDGSQFSTRIPPALVRFKDPARSR